MSPQTVCALVHYDRTRRRLWLAGQRIHHGAVGAVSAATSVVLLALTAVATPAAAVTAFAATLLIAHDWKDRRIWFERGHGTQA